ncbi:nudix family, partial [Apiospora phragmitis]
ASPLPDARVAFLGRPCARRSGSTGSEWLPRTSSYHPPAKTTQAQHYSMISSSPELPSLAELAQRHTKRPAPLRSGSNAAPIPATARSAFTSTKDVLREASDIDAEPHRPPSPKPKPKAVRKRATKSQPQSKATAAPDQQEPIVIPSSSPTDKPVRKSRSKKTEAAQSTISSRVTKATTTDKSKARKTETVSRHFASAKEKGKAVASKESPQLDPWDIQQTDPPGATIETEDPAQPNFAIPRRRGWTPPPPDALENSEVLSSSSKAPVTKEGFQNMCQDFARPAEMEPIFKPSAEIAEFLKKRKLNDLPANEQASRSTETSPTKPAAAKKKKKIRTITELATAPYQLPELPDILLAPGNAETLLEHFDFDGAVKEQADHQRAVMDVQETKSKGKKKKAPAKPRKKKAGTAEDPILLSPNSAMKQASNVDFLFGTSSQLQSDEPAEVLRDLQAAIQASNRANDDEDDDDRSGLWHKGARDFDGSLLEFKVRWVEATRESPSPVSEASPTEKDGFPDISKICALPPQVGSSSLSITQNTQSQQKAVPSSRTTLPSSEKSAATVPPPSRPAVAAKSKRPDFTLFTDAQLSRKISTYGFKPMKRRSAMIALLEQCWDGQQPATAVPTGPTASDSSTLPPNAGMAAPASAPPSTVISPAKKPRGRPKKDTTATASTAPVAPESPKRPPGRPRKGSGSLSPVTSKVKTPVRRPKKSAPKVTKIEIADSDEEEVLSVSAGRSSPDPVFSSPPPLDLSISEDAADLSLNLSPTEQENSSFTFITKAVTSAPRSTDPQSPSWHELMLMYTPVVLEDLAAWLNAGELTRVGYDGEVSAGQVKQWCESKSVICLWRANVEGVREEASLSYEG